MPALRVFRIFHNCSQTREHLSSKRKKAVCDWHEIRWAESVTSEPEGQALQILAEKAKAGFRLEIPPSWALTENQRQ